MLLHAGFTPDDALRRDEAILSGLAGFVPLIASLGILIPSSRSRAL